MKNKGISMIVLIVTIIVIMILATAIILGIAKTNIISNSKEAVFKSDISNMKDELSSYLSSKYVKKRGDYNPDNLQANEDGIWYGNVQEEGTITDIIKSMPKKYVGKLFIQDGKLVANKTNITVEEEKWLQDMGIYFEHKIDIGKINIITNKTKWVNTNVEAIISYAQDIPDGYIIEYKLTKVEDDKTVTIKNWTTYNNDEIILVEENNTRITARIYNYEKDDEVLSNSCTVSNIDKENPTKPDTLTLTAQTNTITAIADGSIDTLSGVKKYQYSLDNSTWQDSGIFKNLNFGVEYTVYAIAVDNVGNVSESKSEVVTVKNLALSVSASGYTGEYDGYEHGISVNCDVDAAEIKYSEIEGNYTLTESPTRKFFGTTTVYYQVTKEGYETVIGSEIIEIKPAYRTVWLEDGNQNKIENITISKGQSITLTLKSDPPGGYIDAADNSSVSSLDSSVATATRSTLYTVTITGVKVGTTKITVKSTAGNYIQATATYEVKVQNPLLSSVVAKGDYVNYPISYTNVGAFSGSITSLTGWRVLYVEDSCVYLVSAGCPEATTNSISTWSALYTYLTTDSNFNKYINTTYSSSGNARGLYFSDLNKYNGSTISTSTTYTNTVMNNGSYYYFVGTGNRTVKYTFKPDGKFGAIIENTIDIGVGMRVVVKLNSTARTTGKNTSSVWQLTTSTGV